MGIGGVVSVLLSAYVKRFSFSLMQVFLHNNITNQDIKNLILCAKASENMICYLILILNFAEKMILHTNHLLNFTQNLGQMWIESLSFCIIFGWSFSLRCRRIDDSVLVYFPWSVFSWLLYVHFRWDCLLSLKHCTARLHVMLASIGSRNLPSSSSKSFDTLLYLPGQINHHFYIQNLKQFRFVWFVLTCKRCKECTSPCVKWD